MNLDGALQTFFIEAQEQLETLESALLDFDDEGLDDEILNEIFRAAHTIKGSAGIFGLDHIVSFTHVMENVLDRARDHQIEIDQTLVSILFKCKDHILNLVKFTPEQFEQEPEYQNQGTDILDALAPYSDQAPSNDQNTADEQTTQENLDQPLESADNEDQCWHISLRLASDCLKNGMDPMSFIKFLSTVGEIKYIHCLDDALPDLENYDPEELYLGYEISLLSNADRQTIEDTFMFVEEGSKITILPPSAKIDQYIELITSLPEQNDRLGEILVKAGAITKAELEHSLSGQSLADAPQKLGETLVEQQIVAEPVVKAALEKQTQAKSANKSNQIRIEADRLDQLINLIGELVINQQRIEIHAKETTHSPLIEAVTDFSDFTDQIRDAALNLRMVAIGATFTRFKRIVRDTAIELDKDINLVIEGAQTELDRLMVEKLTDPLTHIVRNAIDHGIESEQVRIENGKSSQGTLKMSAYHEAGHIVIEVSDDGGGIDKQRVRQKAIDKGIIEESGHISDNELLNLIFHPGFSTATAVTNLSGRGVGMDVVKRNVESLQGSIEIASEENIGSTFKIRLPLTLAIIDGFHVQSSDTHFIIPKATIIECIDFESHIDHQQRNCIKLRGEMIPYLSLNQLFVLPEIKKGQKQELVVVQFGAEIAGIVVEKLYGEIQTVVKPLGPMFQPLKGFGGSSLLGNGDIAFILDIPQLIEVAITQESSTLNIQGSHS